MQEIVRNIMEQGFYIHCKTKNEVKALLDIFSKIHNKDFGKIKEDIDLYLNDDLFVKYDISTDTTYIFNEFYVSNNMPLKSEFKTIDFEDILNQSPTVARQQINKEFYHLDVSFGELYVDSTIETNSKTCDIYYNHNNYFTSKQRAQEVLNKIIFHLRLERLHDIYCYSYHPNWNDKNEAKYYIIYNYERFRFECSRDYNTSSDHSKVYFPSSEIAQKVCNILNSDKVYKMT